MASDEFDDEYVANLLKQDARNAAKEYKRVGLEAFKPKRYGARAPKPNTNFLQHLIRQTEDHNAVLLAKEAEESRTRLKELNGGKGTGQREGNGRKYRDADRLTPLSSGDDSRSTKRRKLDNSDIDETRDSRRKRIHNDERREHQSRRERDDERNGRESRRSRDDGDDERLHRSSDHSKRPRDRERRHDCDHGGKERPRRRERSRSRHRHRASYSGSHRRTRSTSPRSSTRHKSSRHRRRSPSPKRSANSRDTHRNAEKDFSDDKHPKRRPPSPASESDPLEAIVGPLPPTPEPAIRVRGRGSLKVNSMGMDARFSSTYDPSADVQLNSDVEDDWGDALEALKDRQRWMSKGADRLRDAGFSDEQVKKWEKGDDIGEEDVVWGSKGQDREWDWGKVVNEDGDVELKADWGRLK